MVKAFNKKKSKRGTARQKFKIEKNVREHARKQRKLAKNDPTWRSKLKKDPGIPNLFPYKEKLLSEIEEKKRRFAEEKLRKKMENQAAGNAPEEEDDENDVEDEDEMYDDEDLDESGETGALAALVASARRRAAEYEGEEDEDEEEYDDDEDMMDEDEEMEEESEGEYEEQVDAVADRQGITTKETSRKAYDKQFKSVVERADVILYVLDSRDPEGTRSRAVEKQVAAAEGGNKQLYFVLNKIDLVPPHVLEGWVKHLSRSYPAVPFRSSNSSPAGNPFNHNGKTLRSTTNDLITTLKADADKRGIKRSLAIGVIGYPNVGKSSIINALVSRGGLQKKAPAPTGGEAGLTKSIREVKLDGSIKLIDMPGIVFPGSSKKLSKEEEQARLVLLNAIPPSQITDPIPAATLILQKLTGSEELMDRLLKHYDLPPLVTGTGRVADEATDFLVQVARKRGRIGRGGIPNINAAATLVVNDWCSGRVMWYNEPPHVEAVVAQAAGQAPQAAENGDVKTVVTEFAKEFDIDALTGGAMEE
ncbi:hypothetical protein G7K_3525-t1 [Saitoella complicata NRRL Y-17804]|uniref:CP-type G domain-containing protein n=1 Tax=Saitoella complicata (strain BCRC 22490 / CBS 7301 / JCM 7358 / NBRC 10748 / NRRL Y-17804) TaxID=698492 RepID=A0A0E9NHR6_SAICN|nr:hypothetical protein G7K_3525-t1 [Saitoella complicata NRRL Y-17804]